MPIASKRRSRSWPSARSQVSARPLAVHGRSPVSVRSGAGCENSVTSSPRTPTTCPVMCAARSLARNATTGAMASAGVAVAMARRSPGSRCVMRGSAVGEMQLQRTPYLAMASATERAPARLLDLPPPRRRRRAGRIAPVHAHAVVADDHAGALGGQAERHRPTDSAPRARHHRHLLVQQSHAALLSGTWRDYSPIDGQASIMRFLKRLLLLAGVILLAVLVHRVGAEPVLATLRALAWWQFIVICLPYSVIAAVDTLGWRFAFAPGGAPFWRLYGARLAGEALNVVTAAGSVGGEAVKARPRRGGRFLPQRGAADGPGQTPSRVPPVDLPALRHVVSLGG